MGKKIILLVSIAIQVSIFGNIVQANVAGLNNKFTDKEAGLDFLEYFPLKVGNTWTYRRTEFYAGGTEFTVTVERDTIINGKRYFYVSNLDLLPEIGNIVRIDSASSKVFNYNPWFDCPPYVNEIPIDSLNTNLNDSLGNCFNVIRRLYCFDITQDTLFENFITTTKHVIGDLGSVIVTDRSYSKGIGMIRAFTGHHWPDYQIFNLKHCTIDGVYYGNINGPQLKGVVTFDDNGDTIRSGFVKMMKMNYVTGNFATIDVSRIDSNGTYKFQFIPQDSVYLVAFPDSANQTQFAPTYAPSTYHWMYASLFNSNNQINSGQIRVKRIYNNPSNTRISGKVYARFGSLIYPLESTFIHAFRNDTTAGYNITDNEGNFKIDSLQHGIYDIIITKPGYTSWISTIDISSTSFLDSLYFEVVQLFPGSVTNILSGRLTIFETGFVPSGGIVKALKFDNNTRDILVLDSARIDSAGFYKLTQLPIDTLFIVAYPNSEIEVDIVPTYFPNTISWIASNKIYTNQAYNNINIRAFKLNRTLGNNTITGNVYVSHQVQSNVKEPLQGAVVYLRDNVVFRGFSVSDSAGFFKIDSVENGNYHLIVDRLGFSSDTIEVSINDNNLFHFVFFLHPLIVNIDKISELIPETFLLHQNYPNPFNPVTKIRFELPQSDLVKLKIYDILGREVAILSDQQLQPGVYEFTFDGSGLSSGIYFYRLTGNNFSEVKRMILAK